MSNEKFKLGVLQTKLIKELRENPQQQTRYQLGYKMPDGSCMFCILGKVAEVVGELHFEHGVVVPAL